MIFKVMVALTYEDKCYDFSGGQIENVTRKCDIESILYGDKYITEERIEQYCKEEVLVKNNGTRIGFV